MKHFDTSRPMLDLTQSQLSMWTGQQLNPDAPLYNMVLIFDLAGPVDAHHFQLAFQALVDRSDAMRTIFGAVDSVPKQQVLPSLSYTVEFIDHSGGAHSEDTFQEWLKKRSRASLDLSHRCFDSVLFKFSDQRFIWYFNQHHLITDAWSVSVQYRAMADLYQRSRSGTLGEAPPLPAFRDFIDFERNNRDQLPPATDLSHWEKVTKQLPPLPRLYSRKAPTATSLSRRVTLDLGAERSERLRALVLTPEVRSWTLHLSLFNIFATTLFAYLYRISGQRKHAVGAPAHNRPTVEFKATPGVCIEIFPMLAEVEEGDTFLTLLQRVRTGAHEFLRYAQPGAGTPDMNRRINVVLNYIHAAFPSFGDIAARSEWIHPGHCDPRHHLRLQVQDFDASGSIRLHFDLNERIFDEEMRETAPIHFLKLLDAFLTEPTEVIDHPGLLTPAEYQKNVLDFNGPAPGPAAERSVLDLWEASVRQTPESLALIEGQERISYQRLEEMSNQLAHHLIQHGIGPGNRVGIYLKRSPDLVVSIWGILKAGAAFVPIPTDYPAQRVSFILEDAAVSMLITDSRRTPTVGPTPVFRWDTDRGAIEHLERRPPGIAIMPGQTAYLLYTSGSTGQPKGVVIAHRALYNYIQWAREHYVPFSAPVAPLFTSIGFDLTVTSLFLPLAAGGRLHIYPESETGPDLALFRVIEENAVDFIKLTPSHLTLLQGRNLSQSRIRTMIVGGEDLRTDLAQRTQEAFDDDLTIYNEYGPTEATVGCIVHTFRAETPFQTSVPIGVPIANMQAYVLDEGGNPTPAGVPGELYLAGAGLADGYWNRPELTRQQFAPAPFQPALRSYRTGDLVRLNREGVLEFLGRKDQQVKIGGVRVELGEIEAALSSYPGIKASVVVVRERPAAPPREATRYCVRCGLPSSYPQAGLDDSGTCNLCRSFDTYRQKARKYFKTMEDLRILLAQNKTDHQRDYDCLMLLSGGKDSTYALAKLVEMGLQVLAFTLDNGYISEGAKANIQRVVDELKVDHIFGTTPEMNAIFVDSLHRHSNVCNGCFKTLYTLSTGIALEKSIPFIVTGLSRGQFFETRLTEELFWQEEVDVDNIDQIILEARKAYHRTEDAVCRLMDVSMFQTDRVFERVQFVDFYRYCDVSLEELLRYLDKRLPWIRPADTGRSTNCLINQVGIYVHKKERGYNNYAFPYSWDVRVGHKTRDAALEEINEEINEDEVTRIMAEIGYTLPENSDGAGKQLVAYYTGNNPIPAPLLRDHLKKYLPDYLVPTSFLQLEKIPLTKNGKSDRTALTRMDIDPVMRNSLYVPPRTQIEEIMEPLWSEVLQKERISMHDPFLDLGGSSLTAIRLMARINGTFELDLPLKLIFEFPTIASLSEYIEEMILTMLDDLPDD